MKTLLIDIETAPMLVDAWGLHRVYVGINQIRDPGGLLCFSAKWLGDAGQPLFWSDHHDGREIMVKKAHFLLDHADMVVTWNGKRFDIPHLNREFLECGLKPPSPYKQVDLYQVAKRQFRFPSNKLDYVSRALGFGGKIDHEGHELWLKCMQGDPDAWRRMMEYNRRDVLLLEDLYGQFLPWISNHPSMALDGFLSCPKCGSGRLQRRGEAVTLQSVFQRYQCMECGGWCRDVKRVRGSVVREVAA